MTTESEAVHPLPVSSPNSAKCKKEAASWKTGAVLRGNNALDAEQLYKLLGLLIIESRVPVAGSKGRIIGPHAYKTSNVENASAHVCDNANVLCARAAAYRDRLSQFGRLGIPLALEVLVLSDCEHSSQVTMSQSYLTDHSIILEQWIVTLVPKQNAEKKVEAIQALLQTVSSYLHFSQLSSWLMRYHGERPKQLHYRLAVYGESSLPCSTTHSYRTHDFPQISAGENKNLHVKCVTLLMSCADAPSICCSLCSKSCETNYSSSSSPRRSPVTAQSTPTSHHSTPPDAGTQCSHAPTLDVPLPRPTSLSSTFPTSVATISSTTNHCSTQNPVSPAEQRRDCSQPNYQATPSKLPRHQHHAPNAERIKQGGFQEEGVASFHDPHGPPPSSTVHKDSTPFPKDGLENLEDIILRFSRLSSAVSPKDYLNSSGASTVFSTRKRGMDEGTGTSPPPTVTTASSQHTTQCSLTRRCVRERSILFSDSSSNESLDRLSQRGRVLYHQKSSQKHHPAVVDPSFVSVNEPYVFYTPPAVNPSNGVALSTPQFALDTPSSISPDTGSRVYTPSDESPCPSTQPSCVDSVISRSSLSTENPSSETCTTPPMKDGFSIRSTIGSSECLPRFSVGSKALFNRRTGLPLQSSPAPVKRNSSGRFDSEDSPSSLCKTVRSCFEDGSSTSFHTSSTQPNMSIYNGEGQLKKCMNGSLSSRTGMSAQLARQVDRESDKCSLNCNANNEKEESVCIPRGRTESSPSYQQQESSLLKVNVDCDAGIRKPSQYSTSAPAASVGYLSQHSQNLVINFEESMLSGRIPPVGIVDGFRLDIGANNVAISQKHVCLPMKVYFFDLSDDNAPSPYLGYVDLTQHITDRRGYRLPKKGTLQLTLFNPTSHVVKVFVVLYDFTDMPANSTTFLRQRTLYMPVVRHRKHHSSSSASKSPSPVSFNQPYCSTPMAGDVSPIPLSPLSPAAVVCSHGNGSTPSRGDIDVESDPTLQYPSYLRYLLHMKFQSGHSGRVYMHKDIRIIFSQDKFEFDSSLSYDLRSFVEMPSPRYCNKHTTQVYTTPRRNPTS